MNNNTDSKHTKKVKEFQENLNIRFDDESLLYNALAHSSYVNEHKDPDLQNNEKLEFLGDSVLALIVIEYLYKNYSELAEGELSKIKAIVVSEYSLASIGRKIQLGDYIMLGKGERQYGGAERDATIADCLEAVFGAYYLDSGLDKSRDFILPFILEELEKVDKNEHKRDYKSELQLIIQQKYKSCPVYETINEVGPDHNKVFHVNVLIEGVVEGFGKGNNKKTAQQEAAKSALIKYENTDED